MHTRTYLESALLAAWCVVKPAEFDHHDHEFCHVQTVQHSHQSED